MSLKFVLQYPFKLGTRNARLVSDVISDVLRRLLGVLSDRANWFLSTLRWNGMNIIGF